jgi:hypothetical protein
MRVDVCGIDPTTSYNIYKLYVLPRLLYGLEILALKTRDIEKLGRYIETIFFGKFFCKCNIDGRLYMDNTSIMW